VQSIDESDDTSGLDDVFIIFHGQRDTYLSGDLFVDSCIRPVYILAWGSPISAAVLTSTQPGRTEACPQSC
jgi:hypothetical protein